MALAVGIFEAIDGPSGDLEPQWSVNITGSDTSLPFQPDSILRSFQDSPAVSLQQLSPAEAIVSISGVSNHIRISQPGSGLKPVSPSQFSVQSDWAWNLAQNTKASESDQCRKRERKWKLGVGIGVGVGGAMSIAAAAFFALRPKNAVAAPTKSP
ncbi:hypothetical protein SAPIO_CDS6875 [Scedosporium apiospermum]|uniref:Uncharacterized protein n=1 Tax=Pseudallescheria apiosperma TaxID=563466 RepID=A0A084G2Y8_PSEDA|nr:uncharacterized protein SAPIO_CDS6875 [Scedosporium apiospermum]KEZ41700.1 hypothetical protein SAPIO_CDS6875 [Scedosporium apiospermum]